MPAQPILSSNEQKYISLINIFNSLPQNTLQLNAQKEHELRNNIRNEINSNAKFKELSGKLTEKKLKELNNSIVDGIINLINDPTSKNLSLCALVGICYEIAKSAGASKSQLTFLINAKSLFEFKITFNQIMGSDTAFEKVSEFSKEIIEYALSKYFFLLAEANPKVKQQLPILLESVRRTMEKLLREQQERLLVEQKEKAKKLATKSATNTAS